MKMNENRISQKTAAADLGFIVWHVKQLGRGF